MDCRLQVYSYGLWEFAFPYSNPDILKRKNIFFVFLFHWWNLSQILNIFENKKIVIAAVFPKLATVEGLVMPLTIQRCLKTSFDIQHVKRFQTVVKSWWEHFYHIFSSLRGEMMWKISPWLKFEIRGLFVNIWAPDYKYPVPDVTICCSLFKSSYLRNIKHFQGFLFHLWKFHQILSIFKQKRRSS